MRLLLWMTGGSIVGAALGFLEDREAPGAVIGALVGAWGGFWLWREAGRRPKAGGAIGSLKPVAIAAVKALVIANVAAVVLVGGCVAWLNYADEADGFPWRDASVELRPLRALKGVALRQSLGDLARVGTFELDESVPVNESSAGRHYVERGKKRLPGTLRLYVVGETVTRISYECRPEPDGSRVNRIQCDDPPSRVFEVFGNGARRLCARVTDPSDPRAKMAAKAFAFDVVDTGTRYITLDDRVRGFVVMEPPDLQGALGGDQPWDRCG